MGQVQGTPLRTGHFYDMVGSAAYVLGQYQCVSQLTASDGSTYPNGISYGPNGLGIKASNTSETTVLDRVIGISDASAYHDSQVAYHTGPGTAWVMASAAIARGAFVKLALNENRAGNVAPVINLAEMHMPGDPRRVLTYSLAMVDDTALTPNSTGSNTLEVKGVGYAMTSTNAKYELVMVDLFLAPFYY